MTHNEKMRLLAARKNENKNAERIISELIFVDGISGNRGGEYAALIEKAADRLLALIEEEGTVTKRAVAELEDMLSPLSPVAKSYSANFVAHAHIDMNWMWGYNETVAVTIDTFRTILQLMREYDKLVFAQSQASTYEIIEKYAPEMLDEIKMRIKEGRWEVTAAEWVEPDKNMPNGESLVRHVLQSKKYLSKLLDISEDSICLDFVPDTFGHNLSVPEILSDAGVKYMYHCRGGEVPCLYRYASPSGKSVLAYREYTWYNAAVCTEKFEVLPQFYKENNINIALCVYGMGDHGGGPSRRDLERLIEYSTWPLTPTIGFGGFKQYFEAVEASGIELPVVDHELNYLFTGCYTTQTRIKMANRISEARMNELEALNAMDSSLTGNKHCVKRLDTAWRKLLFNHFHDILPGSGTIETREYAMGQFQEILAAASSGANAAMRSIAEKIDTTSIPFDNSPETTSEGSGVGFFQDQTRGFRMAAAERGRGAVRAFHLFNTTAVEREEYTEILIWDYNGNLGECEMTDPEGNKVPFTKVSCGNGYWSHKYDIILVKAKLVPYGYTTLTLAPKKELTAYHTPAITYEHVDDHITDAPIVMENSKVRMVFDHPTLMVTELYDKVNGKSLISAPACYFELINENPIYGMSAWRVGPYMSVKNLNREADVRMTAIVRDPLYTKLTYTVEFGMSKMDVTVTLREDSNTPEFALRVDWNEVPEFKKSIPQLRFAVPVGYAVSGDCLCEIPFGEIRRKAVANDIPCITYLTAEPEDKCGSAIGIVTDSKYGFRYYDKIVSVDLIRSAYDPDPYPDRGIHNIRVGVMAATACEMKSISDTFNHPICYTPATEHKGELALAGSVLKVNGGVKVSCFKDSEDGEGRVVRIYDACGVKREAELCFDKPVSSAYLCDSNENIISALKTDGNKVYANVEPYSIVTVRVSK